MAGILGALETFKEEKQSIDSLASLPQTLIMQMAQKGHISKTDLPMILSRKAEIAQNQAQLNALRQQQTGGQPPSIMEQIMATNARQEAPREMTDVGIASNPVPEMRMAGGGIVAFEEGGLTDDKRAEYERYGAPGSLRRMFGSIYDYYASPSTMEGVRRNISNTLVAASPLNPSTGGTGIISNIGRYLGLVPKAATMATGASGPLPVPGNVKETPAAPVQEEPRPILSTEPAKGKEKETKLTAPADPYAELKAMFKEQAAERAKERGEAKNMALLQAGLNIMGGTSPYAFSNIGAGGAAGAKALQEGMADIRKAEREGRRDYADIIKAGVDYGQRERQLDIQKLAASREPGELQLVRAAMADPKLMKAVQELYGAKKTDAIMQMLMQSGGGKLDRASLQGMIENYGIKPTR